MYCCPVVFMYSQIRSLSVRIYKKYLVGSILSMTCPFIHWRDSKGLRHKVQKKVRVIISTTTMDSGGNQTESK